MASNESLALSNPGKKFASGYAEDEIQPAHSRQSHRGSEDQHVSLPTTDGARNAWMFLADCFCVEALMWGEFIHMLQL